MPRTRIGVATPLRSNSITTTASLSIRPSTREIVESSTSSRSSDAGIVWATRCRANSRELASASMLTRSWAKRCWRALSSADRCARPLVNATMPRRAAHTAASCSPLVTLPVAMSCRVIEAIAQAASSMLNNQPAANPASMPVGTRHRANGEDHAPVVKMRTVHSTSSNAIIARTRASLRYGIGRRQVTAVYAA